MKLVENRFEELCIGNDDQNQFFADAINTLSERQKEIFYKECEIANKLDAKYGFKNVTDEMYEQAFIEAGLESR